MSMTYEIERAAWSDRRKFFQVFFAKTYYIRKRNDALIDSFAVGMIDTMAGTNIELENFAHSIDSIPDFAYRSSPCNMIDDDSFLDRLYSDLVFRLGRLLDRCFMYKVVDEFAWLGMFTFEILSNAAR